MTRRSNKKQNLYRDLHSGVPVETKFVYDENGERREVVDLSEESDLENRLQITYDSLGRIKIVESHNQRSEFVYDNRGSLIRTNETKTESPQENDGETVGRSWEEVFGRSRANELSHSQGEDFIDDSTNDSDRIDGGNGTDTIQFGAANENESLTWEALEVYEKSMPKDGESIEIDDAPNDANATTRLELIKQLENIQTTKFSNVAFEETRFDRRNLVFDSGKVSDEVNDDNNSKRHQYEQLINRFLLHNSRDVLVGIVVELNQLVLQLHIEDDDDLSSDVERAADVLANYLSNLPELDNRPESWESFFEQSKSGKDTKPTR